MQPSAIPDFLFALWRITLPLRELTQFVGMVPSHQRRPFTKDGPRGKKQRTLG